MVKLVSIDNNPSTKLIALNRHLSLLPKGVNAVIFSQWASMLDLVQSSLTSNNFTFVRLDGSMSQKSRENVLNSFKNGEAQILIATLRSSGVGLNLTTASRVFLLDPWYVHLDILGGILLLNIKRLIEFIELDKSYRLKSLDSLSRIQLKRECWKYRIVNQNLSELLQVVMISFV